MQKEKNKLNQEWEKMNIPIGMIKIHLGRARWREWQKNQCIFFWAKFDFTPIRAHSKRTTNECRFIGAHLLLLKWSKLNSTFRQKRLALLSNSSSLSAAYLASAHKTPLIFCSFPHVPLYTLSMYTCFIFFVRSLPPPTPPPPPKNCVRQNEWHSKCVCRALNNRKNILWTSKYNMQMRSLTFSLVLLHWYEPSIFLPIFITRTNHQFADDRETTDKSEHKEKCLIFFLLFNMH